VAAGGGGRDHQHVVHTTTDTTEIVDRLDKAVMVDPVRNTVFATVRSALRAVGEGGWAAAHGGALAARSSAAHPVALTTGWAEPVRLGDALADLPSIAGIGGPVDTVEQLLELLDRTPETRTTERLYRLTRLSTPRGVPGSARPATEWDTDLVASWLVPHTLETFGAIPDDYDPVRLATAAIGYSRTWLWLAPSGAPVSMAARRPPAAGVSRIGPVYTPPEHRRHGYGSAVTARAAFDILDSGAVPVLYADRSNATSNKIYRAIGFRPVTDRLSVTF
jgi:GNAT superfamily N-acetyltransferase